MICKRSRPGHLSVRVGDSSRRSEEIAKNLDLRLSVILLSLLLLSELKDVCLQMALVLTFAI